MTRAALLALAFLVIVSFVGVTMVTRAHDARARLCRDSWEMVSVCVGP